MRSLIVSVVLAIAVGPSVGMACKALCIQHAIVATPCHDDGEPGDAASVIGSATCDEAMSTGEAALAEGARRSASVSDVAVTVPRWQFVPPALDTRSERASAPVPLLEKRPLETSLRI